MRDTERAASYRAEDDLFAGTDLATPLTAAAACILGARYVDTLTGLHPRIEFVPARADARRSTCVTDKTGSTIRLCAGVFPYVVAHEIAHALTSEDVAHGPSWRAAYAEVLGGMFGEQWRQRLLDTWAEKQLAVTR